MFQQKGWWKSKTVWTGLVTAILGVLGLFGVLPPALDATMIVEAIVAVLGVLVVIFRGTATEEVVLLPK